MQGRGGTNSPPVSFRVTSNERMTRLQRTRLLHTIAFALLINLFTVSPTYAESQGQMSNVAMNALGPQATAKGYYDLEVKPGERFDLPFSVTNPSDQPVEVTVYPADAATGDGGGIYARGPQETSSQVGTWLTPASRTFVLAPGENRAVSFSLQVPPTAQSGQHIGAVIARVFQPGTDPGKPGENQANLRLNYVRQVLIAVVATVPGPVTHKLTPTGIEHFYQAEQLWLRVKVRNDGSVIEKPRGSLRILDQNQQVLSTHGLMMESVYPGTEGGILVPVDAGMAKFGAYTAAVELTDANQQGTQGSFPVVLSKQEVKDSDEFRYQKIKEQRTDDVLVLPLRTLLLVGGMIAVVIVGGAGLLFFLRRRNAQ